MSLGPFIRSMFGSHERQVSEAYRSIYLNIEAFAECLHQWTPSAKKILEVGCGEGAVTERLNLIYPQAEITAIDLSPRLGRLYAGQNSAVQFLRCDVEEIAAAEPGKYDLVVLCDVLHHVPQNVRQGLLDAVRKTLAPGGTLVFKDWERSVTPIHWMCYASDRWLTGDRISYMTRLEMRDLLACSFGQAALVAEARVAPWHNNIATLVRR